MKRKDRQSAFTLVELLVVIGIIAILIGLAMPGLSMAVQRANYTGCMSRMRSLGIAFTTYASDNDGQFPGRVTGTGNNKWPTLLLPYVGIGPIAYVDPGDPVAKAESMNDLISNAANNGSFFFNGFNDLGSYTNENITVRLENLTNLSNLILLGEQIRGSTQFYMDFVEGNQDDILNKSTYFKGSCYTFADGSSRFISLADYNNISPGNTESDGDKMWLVNQSYAIPPVPPGH